MTIDYTEIDQRILSTGTNEYFDYLVKEINEETDPVKRNKLKQAYFIELYSGDTKEIK